MARFNSAIIIALTALVSISQGSAFAPTSTSSRVETLLYGNTKLPPAIPMPKATSYGEESRKYRRTVFTHDDWVKHRSPDRFIRNLSSIWASGVYKNLANEVIATTSVATFVVLYNMMVGGYTDFGGVPHEAPIQGLLQVGLPLAPFTLSSPSLGLLLGKFLETKVMLLSVVYFSLTGLFSS